MGRPLLNRLFLPLSLLVLLAAGLVVPLPFFLEAPAGTVGLADKVEVAAPEAGTVHGDYLLPIVHLRRGTVAGLVHGLLDPEIALVARDRVVPPGEDEAVYFERQRRVFTAAADVAAAVGLRAAGFDVDLDEAVRGSGAVVVRVLPDAPAEGLLEPGDVIVAVDGRPVGSAEELGEEIRRDDAPRARRIEVERDGRRRVVEVVPGEIPTPQGPAVGIGVEIQTADPRVDLPVPVRVEGGDIGGPSAGLLLALTVYDMADADADLAAGRLIAGTGQMQLDGEIGRVGGIHQKVVGARRDGADVFVVHASQVAAARAALGEAGGLELVGAETFEEALAALRDR